MAQPALADIRNADRTVDARASRILARSLFRDMRSNGYGNQQILALATELIDLVTRDMRGESDDAPERPHEGVELQVVGGRS
jgi:hypothetical protein